jgi:hypothetical protein
VVLTGCLALDDVLLGRGAAADSFDFQPEMRPDSEGVVFGFFLLLIHVVSIARENHQQTNKQTLWRAQLWRLS